MEKNKQMKTIIIFGGNMPETLDLFNQAEAKISSFLGKIIKKSFLYKSTAWGFDSDNNFLNQVIEIETYIKPLEQISILLRIENELGRQRNNDACYISRGIDLDILFIDDLIIKMPSLTVPHQRLHLRRFALVPLNEKWKDKIHPILKKTMNELLQICPDKGSVTQLLTV